MADMYKVVPLDIYAHFQEYLNKVTEEKSKESNFGDGKESGGHSKKETDIRRPQSTLRAKPEIINRRWITFEEYFEL